MYRLFPCISIFRGEEGGLIKSAKKMCICDYVKNYIGTCKKCVFRFEKGFKRISILDSCKIYCSGRNNDNTLGVPRANLVLKHWS